ncbi:TadE/TadG family type IV pilus assembly protein [Paenibacillus rhizoplanae]
MIPLREDEGSFTIEASLLLPILMGITMVLLFFSLYSYQKSMLLQIASATAERAAYNWENSNRAVSGEFQTGNVDPLYWRIGEDGLLASLFGSGAESGSSAITLPGNAEEGGPLPVVKLRRASQMVPAGLQGGNELRLRIDRPQNQYGAEESAESACSGHYAGRWSRT